MFACLWPQCRPWMINIGNSYWLKFRYNKAVKKCWEGDTVYGNKHYHHHHHYHKHPGLGHLARSVSGVTVTLSNVFSVSQLFSFLVGCSGMTLKGFGFVAFFAGVRASSFCIYLSCLVCILSVVCGVWSRCFMVINSFRSYIRPRPTVWFSSSAPMSEDVRHGFRCVCSPSVRACPTLFLM
jgi:hypothetical protein